MALMGTSLNFLTSMPSRHKGASALVRLPVMAHAPLVQRRLQLAVMLVRD